MPKKHAASLRILVTPSDRPGVLDIELKDEGPKRLRLTETRNLLRQALAEVEGRIAAEGGA